MEKSAKCHHTFFVVMKVSGLGLKKLACCTLLQHSLENITTPEHTFCSGLGTEERRAVTVRLQVLQVSVTAVRGQVDDSTLISVVR